MDISKRMALNIKNAETEKLARELARRRKQSITAALTEVLRKEVERERRKPTWKDDMEERMRRIDQIVARYGSFPVIDSRGDDDILGYDDRGLFD